MINALFHCEYNPQKFHCVHFVIKAAQLIYGLDYSKCFVGLTGSLDEAIKTSRTTVHQNRLINRPVEGCIVLMTYQDGSSHVGLFYRHRIFHLTEKGVSRPTLNEIKPLFKRMRFYEPNLHHSEWTGSE